MRGRPLPPRRGRFTWVPPASQPPPLFLRCSRPRLPGRRAWGRIEPPWTIAAPAAPVWVPCGLASRRPRAPRRRGGTFAGPPALRPFTVGVLAGGTAAGPLTATTAATATLASATAAAGP